MGNKQTSRHPDPATVTDRHSHESQQTLTLPGTSSHSADEYDDDVYTDEATFTAICAMDFGTTYSGYAFGFKDGLAQDSERIFMNKNWGMNLNMQSHKTPTCVLTGPQDLFVAFGYEAEEKYSNFKTEKEIQHYHMFRHFKMSLMKENLTRNTKLEAVDGYKMPALVIFTFAIEYLKNHLLEALKKQVTSDPDASMIRWVVTVPAIWSDASKQFMREAAWKAGCMDSKLSPSLVLALEPEAASLHSRDLPVNTFVAKRPGGRDSFDVGTQYIIVDAGGGTTDITVHKIVTRKHVEEIYKPSGGAWGSTQIDKKFERLLCQIFGNEFINYMKSHYPYDWLNLMLKFEKAKKSISLEQKDIAIELSYNIDTVLKEKFQRDMHDTIDRHQHLGVSFKSGYLAINHNSAMELVMPVVSNIVDHVTDMLQQPSLSKVSALILVGGFGESPILKSKLEEKVLQQGIKVIVPHEAQLAVLRGAVKYGNYVKAITNRIMKHTYGVDMEPRFDIKKHRRDKRKMMEGKEYCNDVFQVFVTKGESKKTGESITKKFFPRVADQRTMSFDIFYTDRASLNEVEYVDSDHFRRAGGLTVMMPNARGGMQREVQVEFFFGGTEIKVKAKDMASGETAETSVDMLVD